MFCRKCGTEIPDGASFCRKCGEPVEKSTSSGESNQSKKDPLKSINDLIQKHQPPAGKGKKYVVITAAVSGVLIIAIILFCALYLPNRAVNAFKKQITNGEYAQAYSTYKDLSSEDRTKANEWMRKFITQTEEKYYKGSLDYETVSDILTELSEFSATYREVSEAAQNIYLDNQSATAYEKAKQLAEDEKWQEAYTQLRTISAKYRLYDEVSALQEECLTNYRAEVNAQMKAYADSEEISQLIALRDSTLAVLPDDKEIIETCQGYLDAFEEKILADAKKLADQGDNEGAIELIQTAQSQYDAASFASALDGYASNMQLAHCEALIAQGDYLGAVKYLSDLVEYGEPYPIYLKKLDEYRKTLVAKTLEQAKVYADNRQFEQAIQVITKVQEVYDCDDLRSAVEEYEKSSPKKLTDFHVIDSNGVEIGFNGKDCFGNTYNNVFGPERTFGDRGNFAIFNLDRRFVRLSGKFVGSSALYKDMETSCKIYADGNLVYESPRLGRTSNPVSFDIDVSGVQQLKVEFFYYSWNTDTPWAILDATVA